MKIKTFVFNDIAVNTYLLWDEDSLEAIIIDPATFYSDEEEELKDFVKQNGLKLTHSLNTHLHFDHVFGNAFIEKEFGLKSEANDADWPWAETIGERLARFGIRYTGKVPALGHILNEGDSITFGKYTINVLHLPGHSPGSLGYYIPEEKAIFSGDVLFQCSIGRTDFADSDHSTLIKNIKEKMLTLPGDTIVYPGHGPATTIETEKMSNIYLQ